MPDNGLASRPLELYKGVGYSQCLNSLPRQTRFHPLYPSPLDDYPRLFAGLCSLEGREKLKRIEKNKDLKSGTATGRGGQGLVVQSPIILDLLF